MCFQKSLHSKFLSLLAVTRSRTYLFSLLAPAQYKMELDTVGLSQGHV
jgi:hypothetical protein